MRRSHAPQPFPFRPRRVAPHDRPRGVSPRLPAHHWIAGNASSPKAVHGTAQLRSRIVDDRRHGGAMERTGATTYPLRQTLAARSRSARFHRLPINPARTRTMKILIEKPVFPTETLGLCKESLKIIRRAKTELL